MTDDEINKKTKEVYLSGLFLIAHTRVRHSLLSWSYVCIYTCIHTSDNFTMYHTMITFPIQYSHYTGHLYHILNTIIVHYVCDSVRLYVDSNALMIASNINGIKNVRINFNLAGISNTV